MLLRASLVCLSLALFLCACTDESEAPEDPPVLRERARKGSRGNFLGIYHPASSTWQLRLQRPGWNEEPTPAERTFVFGMPNDTPVVGDWDGDGAQTPGVFRAGTWTLSDVLDANPGAPTFRFGSEGDLPVVGDWDGDGIATVGTFRDGEFALRNTNSEGLPDFTVELGKTGDVPVAGDWDGDGADTVGVYEPDTGNFVLLDEANDATLVKLGMSMAQPVVGDWDDNRRDTVGARLGVEWTLLNDHRVWEQAWPDYGPDAEQYGLGEIAVAFGEVGGIAVTGNWIPDADRGYPAVSPELRELFPLAVDYQNPDSFEGWRDAGVNTVIRVRSATDPDAASADEVEKWTGEANRLGLKMIREPRADAAADDEEPNLLAFMLQDEPEIQDVDPYDEVARTAVALRANGFRQRPIFTNFAGWSVLRQTDGYFKYGPGDRSGGDFYTRYVRLQDWVAQDIYAISQMLTQQKMGVDDAMATLPITIDKLRRWAPTKPQFAYIETAEHNDNRDSPRQLSSDEFRAQVWLAIVRGVRGIFYFAADQCGRFVNGMKVNQCTTPDGTRPDVRREISLQNERITGLTHVLQGEINPLSFSVSAAAPLETAWRASDGENYIFAVNPTERAVQPWIRVEGVRVSGVVEVMFEGRTIETVGGYTFLDRLPPLSARVYRFR